MSSPDVEPTPPAAPAEAGRPASAPTIRGVGLVASVAAFALIGAVDGMLTLYRAPRGTVGLWIAVAVLFHAVAAELALGLIVGALQEIALASARRSPPLARLGAFAIGGPRRWFAPDPGAATVVLAALLGLGAAIAPLFPVTLVIVAEFHSHLLAALAVVLTALGGALLGALLVAVLLAPLAALARRAGRFGSPGVALVVAALPAVAIVTRLARKEWATIQNLELGAAALVALVLVVNVSALITLGARVARTRRALPLPVPAIGAGLAIAAFLGSAFTFGSRQTVATLVESRSALAKHVVHGFQLAIDRDHDGYSPLFGGGDCNDHDPAQNPGAIDLPGNGVDENCSGSDARVESDESDGYLAPIDGLPRKPSFLLISVDAMRPDHMGAYGYRRPTTPNLDAFALGAARFTSAYCASPRSLRSFASIWTGRYASLVTWGDDVQYPPLRDENITLAELLAKGGYATGAFNNVSYFSNTLGFFQGFTTVSDGPTFKGESGPAIAKLMTYLRDRAAEKAPFFTWIHLMEPHDPYDDRTDPQDFGHEPMDQYDEGIARADQLLAPLLALSAELSATQPIYTWVFGDHGEGFGEHGFFHHSFDLHEEALRVPLLVRGPGIAPGPREALTSLLDLHPTLLNLAGLTPGATVSGRSLIPVLREPGPGLLIRQGERDHLYGEVIPDGIFPVEHKSLYQPPYKLLTNLRRGTSELYDLARDRRETKNLYDERPAIARALRERLLSWTSGTLTQSEGTEKIAAARLAAEPPMQHPLHVEMGEVMQLLGYDLADDRIPIGDTLRATFYYRVITRTRDPMWMNVRFEPVDGGRQLASFHARHFPINGRYPTTKWAPGEILKDEVVLRIEPDVRPTRMRIKFFVETDLTKEIVAAKSRGNPRGGLDLDVIEVLPAR